MKMFYALVFARPQPTQQQINANLPSDLDDCFARLSQSFQNLVNGPSPHSPTLQQVDGFLTYYANNYMVGARRAMCNMFAVSDGEHKTNNDLEGLHRKMNEDFKNKQHFWKFVKQIQTQQKEKMAEVQMIENGQNVARKPTPWQRRKEEALSRMKRLYIDGEYPDVMTYITNISQRMAH
jgi:hypothetical protein